MNIVPLLLGQLLFTPAGSQPTLIRQLKCSGDMSCSIDGNVGTMSVSGGSSLAAPPLYVDGGYVFCPPAALNQSGCVAGVAGQVQTFSGIKVFDEEPSFSGSSTYFPGATASADFYNGIACGGPIIANANGNGLRLAGRRLDGVANVYVQNQHWIDGGVQFAVNLPVCGFSAPPILGATLDHPFFGGGMKPDCSGSADLDLGAFVDNGLVAGHTSMMAGGALSLVFNGNLSGNHAAWELPGPVAPNPANYSGGVVCTEADAGTYFCYAGRHGAVVAGTRAEMKQGWIFEVSNSGRASGNHVFYVSYWGSFGQEDQIFFSQFPDAGMPGIVTSQGQYAYGFAGELAHDRVVLGDYTTGRWRSRETNPDGGPEWVALLDTNDPIPATQISGTLACSNGGTGLGAPIDDTLLVGTSSNLYSSAILPNCTDTGGQHLNYIAASNTFSCGTSSSGGGSGNFVETSIALDGSGVYSVVVTGQSWVTTNSKITCTPFGTDADGLTPEAVAAAALTLSWSTPVAATGFTVWVDNPRGLTGTVRLHCSGA